MFSRIHSKLGTAGFIISIVALIAALSGGAYAASGGLNGKQKKEVEKIAKKFAGKPGASGAAGPVGPAGAPGAKGDAGPAGANGTDGSPGTNGAPGSKGEKGETGFTTTLPAGKTETGVFDMSGTKIDLISLSYAIPLNEAPTEEHVKVVKPGETGVEGCEGGAEPIPTAEPGFLCLYITETNVENSKIFPGVRLTKSSGAIVNFVLNEEGPEMLGVWAVTAE